MLNLRLALVFFFVVRHVNKPHFQKKEQFYLQECMQTLMVDPVGICTTCACMHASQKTVYSTCAGQSNMSKTKSKGGKETARKKKEKERNPPLVLNHHKDCNILLSIVVTSYTK